MVEARVLHEVDEMEEQALFAGEALYALRYTGAGFNIVSKRVNLLNSEAGLRGIAGILLRRRSPRTSTKPGTTPAEFRRNTTGGNKAPSGTSCQVRNCALRLIWRRGAT